MAGHENSGNNTQLLEELEALSSSLYQSHTAAATRRTASLALPRNTPIPTLNNDTFSSAATTAKPRSASRPRRRLSLSPWRSRPNNDQEEEQEEKTDNDRTRSERSRHVRTDSSSTNNPPEEGSGGGAWKNWKPIRALSHIGMQKLSCLFSVEVVTVQNLPASMNGLRLSVCVRKKETRDGAVQTMPSRVSQGAADFEETLFLRCHVYCSEQASDRSRRGGKTVKFEPRPFWVYAFAVDAGELDFGRSSVDLTQLIQESIEKSHEGARVRTWDVTFGLAGKAKGGDLVVKLGFQIMEKDGGIGIYNYNTVSSPNSSSPSSSANANTTNNTKSSKGFLSPSFARKQSKSSFSVPSPKLSSKKEPAWTPLQGGISSGDEIDDLNLDEPEKKPETQSKPPEVVVQAPAVEPELDLPDFEVVDKGVEFQEIDNNNTNVENEKKQEDEEEEEEEEENDKSSVKSVVKEVDHVHVARLSELDSIAQQIKALESIMGDENENENENDGKKISRETKHKSQRLEADEETVTREFLQLLEDEEDMIDSYKLDDDIEMSNITPAMNSLGGGATELDSDKTYISDLGKNLGCVVRTRDGGYLAAMNPLETETTRKETPKLAMQISKPFVVAGAADRSGFELFQAMASMGAEELSSTLGRVLIEPMDELMGKTAEKIAFEGIAGAVISGRNRVVAASSSAGGAIAAARAARAAMSAGRQERVATGIWNVSEEPVGPEEAVAFSMQRIEAMAVEGIKIQADMADEEAPFDVPPSGKKSDHPLSKVVPLEEWVSKNNSGNVKSLVLAVGIQLRDPVRRYEAVGGPMVGIIYADGVEGCDGGDDDEKRFKVTSVHLGGVRVNSKKVKSSNNSNKQRLTAMQWLVGYGFGSSSNKIKVTKNLQSSSQSVKGQDVLWSLSSRVMADMWLKSMRNPDVKFTN